MRETAAAEDAALVARARSGDHAAFEALVRRHTVALYRLAVRLTGSPITAEDVVQEAWIAAWRFLSGFDERATLTTWLYRLTTNAAFKAQRGRRAVPVDDEVVARGTPAVVSSESSAQSAAQRRAVRAAVAELPMSLRGPIVLRYFEGLGVEETADVLGVSTSTVRGRLQRGRAALAASLEGWA